MAWRPSWSTDRDHFSNLSFPHPKEAPYEIWAKLAQQLQRRSRLKMLMDGRTDGRWMKSDHNSSSWAEFRWANKFTSKFVKWEGIDSPVHLHFCHCFHLNGPLKQLTTFRHRLAGADAQANLSPYYLLTLVLLNPDIPWLCKQCRSRSVGFFRSQLILICTVCH